MALAVAASLLGSLLAREPLGLLFFVAGILTLLLVDVDRPEHSARLLGAHGLLFAGVLVLEAGSSPFRCRPVL